MSRKTRPDKRSSAKNSVIRNSANSILSRFSSVVADSILGRRLLVAYCSRRSLPA